MRTVHKFELKTYTMLKIPASAKLLHVAEQGERVQMWVELETSDEKVERYFESVPTGGNVPDGGVFVGTFFVKAWGFVFHLYERSAPEAHP